MFKIFLKLLIVLIFFTSTGTFGLSSSSYLIANSALDLYDFKEAYSQFIKSDKKLNESDLHNKLLTMVYLNLLSNAHVVAKDILSINKLNQEAWIVYLAYSKIHNKNKYEAFNEYKKEIDNLEMDLLNFIFFNLNGEIKNNKEIARSIFEIVKASTQENQNQYNYKFLLFYLSLANLFDPKFNEAYYYSAQIHQLLKDYYNAENLYKKIEINHNLYVESQKNIAINKSKMGFFKKGEQLLLELIERYPLKDSLVFALADLYRYEQKYKEAIIYYTKNIISLDDNYLEYWRIFYLRGICFERLSKWNLAEKDFLNSLKIKPDSPQVLNYLAYGWIERDQNFDKAMIMLKKAYKANPDSYYILDSLAWGYYKINELSKAVELMEEVINMAPGEVISLDHLADIYYSLDRKREAIFFWKQALDLALPDEHITELIKKKLYQHNAG